MKSTLLIASAFALLTLTACDQTSFLAEAGASVDEGGFGQPTMINCSSCTGPPEKTELPASGTA